MSSKKQSKVIKEIVPVVEKVVEPESSSDESEVLEKPKRKSNYVLTPARKAAFEKARIVRAEKIAVRKGEKDKKDAEYTEFKEAKQAKKTKKVQKRQEEELKALDTSSDEETVVVVKKKKPKKKIIYVSEDDDDNKNNVIIINKKDTSIPVSAVPASTNRTVKRSVFL
jgi:hypothetical protein